VALVKPEGMLLCAASTHEGEEALILEAYLALKKQESNAKLLLVPSPPERFDKVVQMTEEFAKRYGLSMQRYSQNRELMSDIAVVDVLGELVNLYAISDLVILGGAFEPIGGHNAAEAAQFGCKIISGKHYFNQKDIFSAIEGIAVVEVQNLSKMVLQHSLLKPARIKEYTDIIPILRTIESTFQKKDP
jgi:3-deoxy-D-manno-octulosonic-acid transferase